MHSFPREARGILAIFVKCEMVKCALRIVFLLAVGCQLIYELYGLKFVLAFHIEDEFV